MLERKIETTISIKATSFRFNPKNLLLLLAFVSGMFALSAVFTTKQIAENSPPPDVTIEGLQGIAEGVYSAGEITEAVKNLPLDAALMAKMIREIESKLAKTTDHPDCEVYFLTVLAPGTYPVLGYGDMVMGYVFLNPGEVWKVGFTGNGQDGRYPGNFFYKSKDGAFQLTEEQLLYKTKYRGTYKQCVILEKLLIYTYPLWSGHALVRPPGCKIFR